MGIFICALLTFCIIMYLVYIMSLPVGEELSDLSAIFYFIAVFEWICAAILLCSIFLYVKRIAGFNPAYGKTVLIEAIVLISANVVAGVFNFWMAKGEV